LVKVPLVTGFFKPILLVPFGLLTSLPEDQVEAMLLHELAHIRRKDYGINLLQAFAETIFFFNPGVLWLSSLMKEEREHCCDDIAIAATDDKICFVEALVTFEAYKSNATLAMGFGGTKNHLLLRAKRIIYNHNKSLNKVEKAFLATSLLLTVVILLACSNPNTAEIPIMPVDIPLAKVMDSRCPTGNKQLIYPQTKADYDAAQARKADQDVLKADEEARKNDEAARKADEATRKADDAAAKADNEARFYDDQVAKAENEAHQKEARSRSVTTRTVMNDTKNSKTFEKEVTENGTKKVSIRTGVSGENLPENLNVDHLTSNIISDLISESIIKDTKNLSYKLSRENLIVNGKVQPESKHAKMRDKYVKAQFHSICYNYQY
jgi:hypothetical protein